jgi:CrcB protein
MGHRSAARVAEPGILGRMGGGAGSALTQAVAVGAGGFFGAILRWGVSSLVHRVIPLLDFPIGTLVVNVVGCLGIGVVNGLAHSVMPLHPQVRLFLVIGLLGGFTTFSTFGYETFDLARDGRALHAVSNVAIHVVVGIASMWLGYALASSK